MKTLRIIPDRTMAGSKTPFSFGVASITTHAWNANATQIALSKNNKEVEIFNAAPGNR